MFKVNNKNTRDLIHIYLVWLKHICIQQLVCLIVVFEQKFARLYTYTYFEGKFFSILEYLLYFSTGKCCKTSRCTVKNVFWKISQNSQENTCAGVFSMILGELSKFSCPCQSRVVLTSETEISGHKVSEKFTFP